MATTLLLLLLACQDPFPEDRHDLAGFRIAAVQAQATDAGLALRAFVYSGHGMWHPAPPDVTWTAGGVTASGPSASLAVSPPVTIEVVATDGASSESATYTLDAAPAPPVVESWARGTVDLTIDDIVTPIANRAAVPAGADTPVAPGGALRFSLGVREADTTTHWMATDGDFAELDAASTDWFAATAIVDNNEIDSSSAIDAGVRSVVALTLDGQGGNSWITLDAPVGILGSRLLVRGRVFPVDAEPGSGLWAVTPVATEDDAGVALTDVALVDDASTGEAVCGQPAASPFDFDAVAEGWCARDDLVGARLVVSGEVVR